MYLIYQTFYFIAVDDILLSWPIMTITKRANCFTTIDGNLFGAVNHSKIKASQRTRPTEKALFTQNQLRHQPGIMINLFMRFNPFPSNGPTLTCCTCEQPRLRAADPDLLLLTRVFLCNATSASCRNTDQYLIYAPVETGTRSNKL